MPKATVQERSIIKTASQKIEVDKVAAAAAQLPELVVKAGGYIEQTQMQSGSFSILYEGACSVCKTRTAIKPHPSGAKKAAKLKESERQWIKLKDAKCNKYFDRFEYDQEGPIEGFACIEMEPDKRTDSLLKTYGILGVK